MAWVRLAVGRSPDCRLWPNQSGVAKHASGHRVRYGLATGSSDLVGILGPIGRWFALEVKVGDDPVRDEQLMWLCVVRSMGGFAAILRLPYGADERAVGDVARAAVARAAVRAEGGGWAYYE